MFAARPLAIALAVSSSLALGCRSFEERVTFIDSMVLAGEEISADVLNQGREDYVQNCYACHGMKGDGKGPAARYYRPPPRDLTQGLYKFGGVVDGLPHDDDFARILKHGLNGTAMLAWDVPDAEIEPIIHYIKTFAEVWEEEEEHGTQIAVDTDPWGGKEKEAVVRGQKLYHGLATCQQCHAAYITKKEIYEASTEVGNKPIVDFRPNPYQPEAKEADYEADGKKMRIMPPDFLFNKVRSGREVKDIYRIISAGIPGTAMPTWHGAMPDPDVWAMAYYVQSLVDMAGKPEAFALRERLASEPEFVPPATPPPAKKPAEGKPAEGQPAPGQPAKPAEGQPAPAKPAEGQPAPAKPAESQPAPAKPAEAAPAKPAEPAPAK
jgi:mono/diheme cytochrome c family protein